MKAILSILLFLFSFSLFANESTNHKTTNVETMLSGTISPSLDSCNNHKIIVETLVVESFNNGQDSFVNVKINITVIDSVTFDTISQPCPFMGARITSTICIFYRIWRWLI